MAKKETKSSGKSFLKKSKVKRKGIHSKKKSSKLKTSKNYKKRYTKQGK
jgi:hypothetical protein